MYLDFRDSASLSHVWCAQQGPGLNQRSAVKQQVCCQLCTLYQHQDCAACRAFDWICGAPGGACVMSPSLQQSLDVALMSRSCTSDALARWSWHLLYVALCSVCVVQSTQDVTLLYPVVPGAHVWGVCEPAHLFMPGHTVQIQVPLQLSGEDATLPCCRRP